MTDYNAKAVYFTIAGKEINIVVFNEHYSLFLKCLLKKVFRTVRVIDIEWPSAEKIYKQAREDLLEEDQSTTQVDTVWYKTLSKDRAVVACKVQGTTLVLKKALSSSEASKVAVGVRKAGVIHLKHWY